MGASPVCSRGRGGATTSRSMRPSPCPHRAVRGGPCESRSRHLGIKSRPRCFPAAVVRTLRLLLHVGDAFGPVGLPCLACSTGTSEPIIYSCEGNKETSPQCE